MGTGLNRGLTIARDKLRELEVGLHLGDFVCDQVYGATTSIANHEGVTNL
jgi:hypothetical protein